MKELIKVDGVTEYFCDIVFVTELYINDVRRESFPRHIYWLLEQIRSTGSYNQYTKQRKKFRKEITLLMMNIGNLYNCVDEVYVLKRVEGWLYIPEQFLEDFNKLIRKEKWYDKHIEYLPKRFIVEEEYHPDIIPNNVENLYFKITKIRPQAIAYLKQKLNGKWLEEDIRYRERLKTKDMLKRIIKLLELMGKQNIKNVDFDKYIDKWTKRLLIENGVDFG